MSEGILDIERYFSRWSTDKSYVFFGASETIIKFRNSLSFEISSKCIVDNAKEKQDQCFENLIVKDPSYLKNINNEYQIIITAPSIKAQIQIKKQLETMGFVDEHDFTTYTKLMMIWKWHSEKLIAMNYAEVMITSKCNLKCQNCGLYIPHYENPQHRSIESIIQDLDSYFKVIDYVSEFRLLGGEPLIHPEITSLVEIIGEKYRGKIGEFAIVTNGIAVLRSELIRTMKKYEAVFHISDYSNQLPQFYNAINNLISVLKENGVFYKKSISGKWLNLGSPFISRKLSKKQLAEKFNHCKMPCRGLYDQKIYYCGPLSSAVMAQIYSADENDYFDLIKVQRISKEERFNNLLNFELGNIQMGYVAFCDYCNGFGCDNNCYVEAGIQIRK